MLYEKGIEHQEQERNPDKEGKKTESFEQEIKKHATPFDDEEFFR
jgi:hypothetical protein